MLRGMQPPFWLSLVYFKIAELRKKYYGSHKVGVHTCWGCLFENGRPFPEYYPTVQKIWDVDAQGAYMRSWVTLSSN